MYCGSASDVSGFSPSSSMMSGDLGSSNSNRVSDALAGLDLRPGVEAESEAIMTFYGDGSGPKKRPHAKEDGSLT